MLSLKSISTVRSAIKTCLIPELEREILCAPGSEYDKKKVRSQHKRKRQWNEIVQRKAREFLTNRGLPEHLQDEIMAIVPAIGLRMLIWATYHEGILKRTREDSIKFLKYTHFTLQGVIDNVKAARELVEDDALNIEQKYVLACIYCFADKIDYLYREMVVKGMKPTTIRDHFLLMKVPDIVTYWTRRQMGDVWEIYFAMDSHIRIQQAVTSGSKAAVEYFWAMTSSRYKISAVASGITEILGIMKTQDDWIVFRNESYNAREETWVPNDYYVDILCFLLSKTTPDQWKSCLLGEDESIWHWRVIISELPRILQLFLRFPYQNNFMKRAALKWDFLSKETYADLLLKICNEIDPQKEKDLYYGEEKSYNYRGLLKEFWSESPDLYKRYVFEYQIVSYMSGEIIRKGTSVFGLVIKCLSLTNFTHEDEEFLRLILKSVSDQERESIFSSKEWRENCLKLMKEEKWVILRRIVFTCFSCKEDADKFKRELSFSEEAKSICFDFLKNNRMNAAESFIEWNALPEQIINDLKREIIQSKHGKEECLKLLTTNRIRTLDKLIRWCLPSNGDAIALKAKLVSELNQRLLA